MAKGKVCGFSSSGACTPICMHFKTCTRNPWKSEEKKEDQKQKKK